MSFRKISLLTIAALLLTTTLVKGGRDGCVSQGSTGCFICYRRHSIKDAGCGPLLPDSDPCQFYIFKHIDNINSCYGCKPGFALQSSITIHGSTTKCVKGTIPGCLREEHVIRDGKLTAIACDACSDGRYSVEAPKTYAQSCKEISNPVPNCLWGGIVVSGMYGQIRCYRCKEGYAVDANTNKCVTTPQKGCWQEFLGRCSDCDPFAGYSSSANGDCYKTLSVAGSEE